MQAKQPLQDKAPPDRYCDLVMKGGITSGIVYPGAIVQLSEAYRFNRIGGTSVGAIAAALTAAAEYRRRHGSMAGFEALAELPQQLAEPVGGQTRLHALFQPEPPMRRLFQALFRTLNRTSARQRALAVMTGLLAAWRAWAAAGAAAGLVLAALLSALGLSAGPVAPLLLAIGGAATGIGLGIHRDLVALVGNGFGLCNGRSVSPDQPGLLPWLHERIQQLAGRGPDDAPLTFEDLWSAPGYPPPWLDTGTSALAGSAPTRSIDLQLFTTSLSQGRPWLLPIDVEAGQLHYRRSELAPYLPASILAHLDAIPQAAPVDDRHPAQAIHAPHADLRRLPMAKLPILVAVRLSLSFPLLLSAVPLWTVDDSSPANRPRLRRCWFSDGGICSNFPMHLFDSFVPKWPTFGINLGETHPDARNRHVWMPTTEAEGARERWEFAWSEDAKPLQALGAFLASIVQTAQTWNDTTSLRMPGVRDRIVHVDLAPGEGGLNLAMRASRIGTMSHYGDAAGALLRERFAADRADASTPAWDAHRWVRANTLLTALAGRLRGVGASIALDRYCMPMSGQIARARHQPPLPDGEPVTAGQAQALERTLAALAELERAFDAAGGPLPYRPEPRPELKVRPPL